MGSETRSSLLCSGRVVLVTGAGRGIGREHALALAAAGARVVVNDLGTSGRGEGQSGTPAEEVVAEIVAAGGEAIASVADVADWQATAGMVATAVETFGGLDVVVNNAGFLRDRMFVSQSEDEWDAVIRVHLKGHFCVARHAAAYWRAEAKAGRTRAARIINTSSGAGLQGSVAQGVYSAAKGGIASLTLVQGAELARYGVTANAIAPAARTRMTEAVFADMMRAPDGGFDAMDPGNISPLVVWLASLQSEGVTGRVFEISGGTITLSDGWRPGASVSVDRRWDPNELGPVMGDLLERGNPPPPVYGA
jgi:NAD(P)-dependent dehydrogenase (short-subunit alcohol dehydrogenase family)